MADYSIEDKEEMIKANVARLNAHKSRLQELIEFIKVSGFHKIGIANCLSMQNMPISWRRFCGKTGLPFLASTARRAGWMAVSFVRK